MAVVFDCHIYFHSTSAEKSPFLIFRFFPAFIASVIIFTQEYNKSKPIAVNTELSIIPFFKTAISIRIRQILAMLFIYEIFISFIN